MSLFTNLKLRPILFCTQYEKNISLYACPPSVFTEAARLLFSVSVSIEHGYWFIMAAYVAYLTRFNQLNAPHLPSPFQMCIWTYGGCQLPVMYLQGLPFTLSCLLFYIFMLLYAAFNCVELGKHKTQEAVFRGLSVLS